MNSDWQEDFGDVNTTPVIEKPKKVITKVSCNLHKDCKKAAAEMKGGAILYHCHDDCCEECFGC